MIKRFFNTYFIYFFSLLIFLSSCSKDDMNVEAESNVEEIIPTVPVISDVQKIQNERIEKVISSNKINISILVNVRDESGALIDGANVTIGDQTINTEKGRALFNQLSLNDEHIGVKIDHINYISTVKNFNPSKSSVETLNIVLFKGESKKITSTTSTELNFDSGIKLFFDGNTFALSNGEEYKGSVTVNTYYHKDTDENYLLAQPGTLVGLDENNTLSALVSEGMIAVDLRDSLGNEVFVKKGKTVKVNMPADSDAPDNIDLWHLNEKFGLWVKTGTAIKNGLIYEFEVTHFSTYNLDYRIDSIDKVDIIVKEGASSISQNQNYEVFFNGIPIKLVKTNDSGSFSLLNAPKGEYELKLFSCNDNSVSVISNKINITEKGIYEFQISNSEINTSVRIIDLNAFDLNNCTGQFKEGETLLLTLFADTINQESILVNVTRGSNFHTRIILCNDIELSEEMEVGFSYEKGNFEGVEKFTSRKREDGSFLYVLSKKNVSLCTIQKGTSLNIDPKLELRIKSSLNISEDQILTKEFASEVTFLNLGLNNNDFPFEGDLESLDFEEISKYFSNLEALNIYMPDLAPISNFDSIINLQSLNIFSLNGGNVSDFSVLSKVKNLRDLSLTGNIVSSVNEIPFLANLESLDLSRNEFIDITDLLSIANLQYLNLSSCKLTNINSLSSLKNLKRLGLSFNSISDISSLVDLTDLETIQLESNIVDDISSLENLLKLEVLNLKDNNVSNVSSLINLTRLAFLYLESNNISDISSLSDLIRLEELFLSKNNISDLTAVVGLVNLFYLVVDGNNISDVSPLFEFEGNRGGVIFLGGNPIEVNDIDKLRLNLPDYTVDFFVNNQID